MFTNALSINIDSRPTITEIVGHPIPDSPQFIDHRGETYGYLYVVHYAGRKAKQSYFWTLCTLCGGAKKVAVHNLTSGRQRSCGDTGCKLIARKDDLSAYAPERIAYNNMVQRCTNPSSPLFSRYGAAGRTVCDRWLGADGFNSFLRDMGPRPGKGLSLERLNNDLGYSPQNCIWATTSQQARNKTNTRKLRVSGGLIPLATLAEAVGLEYTTLKSRIERGWSVEKALTTPLRSGRKKAETIN